MRDLIGPCYAGASPMFCITLKLNRNGRRSTNPTIFHHIKPPQLLQPFNSSSYLDCSIPSRLIEDPNFTMPTPRRRSARLQSNSTPEVGVVPSSQHVLH